MVYFMPSTAIVWLRNDLRLQDNPALYAAAKEYDIVVPLYIHNEHFGGKWAIGSASKWWLHHSLHAFSQQAPLALLTGDTTQVMNKVIEQLKPDAIYWNRRYEPYSIEFDTKLKTHLVESIGIKVQTFKASLLFEPWEQQNSSNKPYQVFTRFWQACLRDGVHQSPLPAPKLSKLSTLDLKCDVVDDLQLLPTQPNWAKGFEQKWQVGEKAARSKLGNFIATGLNDYYEGRNFPSKKAVSELSPHLHFGEISPLQIWHEVEPLIAKFGKNASHFLSEIGWREFSHHLLFHFPNLHTNNFKPSFDNYPWDNNPEDLKRWQQGQTGYPIVDAGMRELWHTGYMHNRVRMIVASFLIKDLFIDWRLGEEWFWDTLVDADLANNSASWQWVAGSGADAAPYYRIFNPVLQSQKFDPTGEYIRHWVPELSALNNHYIHEPWSAPSGMAKDYPKRIVLHEHARQVAMQKYKQLSA